MKYKKILILGSGALKIGEAGEFDYSGSQAIKALKEENIEIILINPNVATIQAFRELADKVYFLPITPFFVEKIIKKEKPDGMLLSFGGQTALNCGLELSKKGVLQEYNVKVLGTPVSAILLTEDRNRFSQHLTKINIKTPKSQTAGNLIEAQKIAKKIGFPVMVRSGFALGGLGSGVVSNNLELKKIVNKALAFAPQVLIEQYLRHYKEIEYEVVRDKFDNCITVCNMENMDPLGIHTGESIVVAPSQTLNDFEYHSLRKISIEIVRSLGIVGECNVQFALNPRPTSNSKLQGSGGQLDYYVIEVNARLSRSSALASKATGYPLAYVAAKLGLGFSLIDLSNKVTGVTKACFEPALDYIVVKMPRWDMEKFKGADQLLGSSMKSVGEVMGIGRTFEEAYQKAIRMLDLDYEGATSEKIIDNSVNILNSIEFPTPKRMFALAKAIRQNIPISKIHNLSGIDPWFLYRIKNIVDHEKELRLSKKLSKEKLLELKQLGFSDKKIGELIGKTGLEIRKIRKLYKIAPAVLQIDTLAGEFPAKTSYLYMTYNASHHDTEGAGKEGVLVLGSGPYRIGSSVEFDWCSVNAVNRLRKHKKKSIIINCNPETVSTDFDVSDRLYFEELTFERITDIYEFEKPFGVIVSVGGQTPNNRTKALNKYGVKILGTSPKSIDTAEDRGKFSALLDSLKISQPAWKAFTTYSKALNFASDVGFPVLIRPSYVLSGSAMNITYTKEDLKKYLAGAVLVSKEYPVIVSKFFERAKEIEFDAVSQKGEIKAFVISEHIENAGVHSGDATICLPTEDVNEETKAEIIITAKKLAKALFITGPFNIQFLAKDNKVYIIEINLRSSRTFPFIAKVTGINLINIFIDSLFKANIKKIATPNLTFSAVKVAQFSFARLTGASPTLGVEMASTGEVACFGENIYESYLKGILATGGKIPSKGIFVSIGGDDKKQGFLESAKNLAKLNLPIYATEKTAKFLSLKGIKTKTLYKIHENKSPNILNYFLDKKIDLVVNIVDKHIKKELDDDHFIRRSAIDNNIFIFTKLSQIKYFAKALSEINIDKLPIKSWQEYV